MSIEASSTDEPFKGEDFKLKCVIKKNGNPAVGGEYFWYKNSTQGQPLTDSSKYTGSTTSELTILNLEASDDDEYECKLLTKAGMGLTEKPYELIVNCKYQPI